LGITLLGALYLCNPIDVQSAQRYKDRFRGVSGFKAVSAMTGNLQQIKSLVEILNSIQNPNYENKSMENLTQSLRYKIKPRNKNQKIYKLASS
jgi:hypothetical protein